MAEFDLSTIAAHLADLINDDHGPEEPLNGLDILDYLGLLGVTLVPSDEALQTYQDRIRAHVMEIEENGDL
jgi:hypothetical protein